MRLVHDLPVRPPAETLGEHVRRTARLAIPVMLGRMGLLVLVAIDIAMTGRAGTRELAAYAVAVAPQVPLLLFGVGLLIGTVVLSAQANGAGESHRCGAVWRVGLLHGLACGLGLGLLCQAGEPFLLLAGQGEALSASGGRVLAVLGWGLPGMLLFSATTMFLESIHRPVPGVLVMVGANLANALLNWMLIYGNLGAPALGAEGAALATTVVRWLMFVALLRCFDALFPLDMRQRRAQILDAPSQHFFQFTPRAQCPGIAYVVIRHKHGVHCSIPHTCAISLPERIIRQSLHLRVQRRGMRWPQE